MIQRIQSVYLFLAALASGGVFGLPFASSNQAEPNSSLFNDASYTAMDNISLIGAFGINALLAIIAIFLFKNRPLQSKIAMLGIALALLSAVLTFLIFMQDNWAAANMGTLKDQYGLGLPLFTAIFFLLARYNINKDNKLVKSMDRLR